jgi:hypothetical protein
MTGSEFPRRGGRPGAFSLVALASVVLSAVSELAPAEPPLPGEPCPSALPGSPSAWAEQEHWAWREVCEGRVADLQRHRAERSSEAGGDPQLLTSRFLETILLHEPYRGAIPRQGVQVRAAHFKDGIDLSHGTMNHDLRLTASSFERALDLTECHVLGALSFEDSRFTGPLWLQGARVEHDLVMSRAQFSGDTGDEVRLVAASVGGSVMLGDVVVSGQRGLIMDSLVVGGHLFMNGNGGHEARYWNVWLQNAKVAGIVNLSDADIEGDLTMRGFEVGSSLSMLNSSFADATMRNLKAKGDVEIEGPKQLHRADHRHSLDLSGAAIGGELILGSRHYGPLKWPSDARLNLRNASVFALQDGIECTPSGEACSGSWPAALELDGFRYEQLGGHDAEGEADMAARPSSWWVDWLAREQHVSPQPYEQLASVLRRLGYKDRANDILYEGKNRERSKARGSERLWLLLQWALIGDGHRMSRSLWWVAAFLFLGVAVLRFSGEGRRNDMPFGFAYSLDMLLPIIKLRDAHYKIDLRGWPRYYFYFHKTMGYVLASFLIAGLSGLTK